jgi:hypothetical protein
MSETVLVTMALIMLVHIASLTLRLLKEKLEAHCGIRALSDLCIRIDFSHYFFNFFKHLLFLLAK